MRATRYHVKPLFRNHQLNFFQKILLKYQQDRPRQLEIKLSPLSPPNPEEKVEHDAPVFELIWFSEDAKFKFPGSPDGSIGGKLWRYGKTAPHSSLSSSSGILVKLKSQKHPISLSSMGAGMKMAIAFITWLSCRAFTLLRPIC